MYFFTKVKQRIIRRRDERGTAILELGLILPMMMLFILGAAEFGMGWRASNSLDSAIRNGARSGTNAATVGTSDRNILVNIGSGISKEQRRDVQRIIIYKATSMSDSTPPEACLDAPVSPNVSYEPGDPTAYDPIGHSRPDIPGVFPSGITGLCNIYNSDQLRYAVYAPSSLYPWASGGEDEVENTDYDCAWNAAEELGSMWSAAWCPGERNTKMTGDSMDYVGVWVEMKYKTFTGIFGDSFDFERSTVYRIEPTERGSA